mgnify:CR=1 FL=1
MTEDRRTVRTIINGKPFEREISVRLLASDFIRHEAELTGTHVGCEHGVCGACTILLIGVANVFFNKTLALSLIHI